MKFDFSEAAAAVQTMISGFIARLPYIVVAFFVFVLFYLAGKGVRTGVRALATRYRRRFNLGLVLGRLTQGLIIFVGLLIALVIAVP